jgi:hypothetical protein
VKRVFYSLTFLTIGLFASWQAVLFAIRIANRFSWPLLARGPHRCWDIEHCHIPIWGHAMIVASIIGPAIAWTCFGFQLGRSSTLARTSAAIIILSAATFAFYLMLYAIM